MANRKEQMKKSLGITEYPWSSEDEDSISQNTQDVHLLRRQVSEPRASVADTPGTSGQQSATSASAPPARRNITDDFWSIMTPHKASSSEIFQSLINDVPPRDLQVPDTDPRSSRPSTGGDHRPTRVPLPSSRVACPGTSDLQRLIAFKKLSRSLNNWRPTKSLTNWYSLSSRGPSRNPIFSPSLSGNRGHNMLRRLQQPLLPLDDRGDCSSPHESNALSATRSQERQRPRADNETIVVVDPPVERTDDDIPELPESLDPSGEENEIPNQVNLEAGTSQNITSGGLSLEEEIVEIDALDETDGPPEENNQEMEVIDSDNVLNELPAVAGAGAEAQPLRQHTESNKRKRDEDDAEPITVKDFNQSLLRLLECPVCLEWMEPPMSQCRRGHLVCTRCRGRLASCPVCRTTFSSVRNRAMEGVAEMIRYPCRHGCGREVRLRRRSGHEASCRLRRYQCPSPDCTERPPLTREHLHQHFRSKHQSTLKHGRKHRFSMKVNSEQHDTWLIVALQELFSLRVDVDIRTWGVIVYVAYIGPKRNARNYRYEVSVVGQHNSRRLVYARAAHSDLESSSLNMSRQDCFHLTLDQALNFLRSKNRHCEPDKFLDFDVEIQACENESREDSDT